MNQYEISTTTGNAVEVNPFLSAAVIKRYAQFLDCKPRTADAYTRNLKPFLAFLSRHNIARPTRADIIAYREEMKSAGLSANTVNAYIIAVRLFVRWLSQEGVIADVADHVKGTRIDRDHKRDFLTAEQVRHVLAGVDRSTLAGKRDYALLVVAITGGLRTIELSRANIGDVRPVADFYALYVQGKGRDDKNEYIRLSATAEAAIREYVDARGTVAADDPLFAPMSHNNGAGRLTTRAISGIIKHYLLQAGYDSERLTAHSLRHTAATLALMAGTPLQEVQQFLRHADISTTMIYNHSIERAKNGSSMAISAAIFSA